MAAKRSGAAQARILLLTDDVPLSRSLEPALATRTIALDVVESDPGRPAEVAEPLRKLFGSERGNVDLIVCDCSGDSGLERAFFACREALDRRVLLLVIGERGEIGPVSTLVAGILKVRPSARIGIVTDHVREQTRPSGGRVLAPWTPSDLAQTLRSAIDESTWSPRAVRHLPEGPAVE